MTTTYAGRGLYAELPSPTKIGMQYFATDHGALYEVNALGQWTVVQGAVMQWNPMLGAGELIAGGTDGTAVRVPAAASDGLVLTSRGGSAGGVDWEAGGAGSGLVTSATLILTNSQLLHLKATPITLVTPAAGTAILPIALFSVSDYSHGIYDLADPDNDDGHVSLVGVSSSVQYSLGPQVAGVSPSQGAVKFNQGSTVTVPGVPFTAEALRVQALATNSDEFTGGGSGNTLTIILYYIAVPTT